MPALHVSLGIFTRLFTLLECACRCLDRQIVEKKRQDWRQQMKALDRARRLEQKASLFAQHISWSCLSRSVEYQQEIEVLRTEADAL